MNARITTRTQTPIIVTLAFAALALMWTRSASAQDAKAFEERATAVDFHLRLSSKRVFGGAINHTFNPYFALEGGVGVDFQGIGFDVTPHWIIHTYSDAGGIHRLSLGAGPSFSNFDSKEYLLSDTRVRAPLAIWFNGELRYTYQHPSGFRLGSYAGITRLLFLHKGERYVRNGDGGLIIDDNLGVSDMGGYDHILPQVGAFMGVAF